MLSTAYSSVNIHYESKDVMKFSEAYTEHSSKHRSYFEIYDELFQNIDRFQEYKILEIGVDLGGGLRALNSYFPNSLITGLDIRHECKKHEKEKIRVVIGSQVDDSILELLANEKFDIIIDDGSHHNSHVSHTFNKLFPSMNERLGIYVIEDIHTSYWHRYGGGLSSSSSMIEKFKTIVDAIHTWCIRQELRELGKDSTSFSHSNVNFDMDYMEKWIKYIQFFENILVIKKRLIQASCKSPL